MTLKLITIGRYFMKYSDDNQKHRDGTVIVVLVRR